MFIAAVPITKLFAWGGGGPGGTRYFTQGAPVFPVGSCGFVFITAVSEIGCDTLGCGVMIILPF